MSTDVRLKNYWKIKQIANTLCLCFTYYNGLYPVSFFYLSKKELALSTRRPVPSTDQAIPSCFYFRISWISMKQRCFYLFPPWVSGGPQKLQTLTASKTKFEKFGPKI